MPSISEDDIHTLRHSLGIEWAHEKSCRNYFCDELPSPQMERLVRAGLMTQGRYVAGHEDHSMRYFHVTECGILLAHEDIPVKSMAKRRYERFLDISDVFPDLTFREFLTSPEFAETRKNA